MAEEILGGAEEVVADPQPQEPINPESTPGGGAKPEQEQKIPYDRFKAKVDEVNALKDELQKFKDAEEAKRLAELSEVELAKEEARKAQEALAAVQADALNAKKQALLVKAGYSDEQIEKYGKFVVGETEEELQAAVNGLVADIPPKQTTQKQYADPASSGGGARQTPQKSDLRDKGASAFQRLKSLGRV